MVVDHVFMRRIDDEFCGRRGFLCIEDEKASAVLIKPVNPVVSDLLSGYRLFRNACVVAYNYRFYDRVFIQYPIGAGAQVHGQLLTSFLKFISHARRLGEVGVVAVPWLEELNIMYMKLPPTYPLSVRIAIEPGQVKTVGRKLRFPAYHVMNAWRGVTMTKAFTELSIVASISVELMNP